MQQKDNILNLTASRISVGPSSIIGVTVAALDSGVVVKYFSGGSLEIGGQSLTWGQGWLLQEPLAINMCGTFYLASSGSTAIAMIIKGLS